MKNTICEGDNLFWLSRIKDSSVDLIYIDPPYNTGHRQKRNTDHSYEDSFSNYKKFLIPRLLEAKRILKATGSIFVQLDENEAHYVKVWLDKIFGRSNFRNEIIWAYDFGARSKKRWSNKHDSIFWYSNSNNFTFNYEAIDRIPYLAPGLCGPKKAAIGKTPTDVWWNTIVSPMGKEKTGYPTQKPLSILNRIVKVHSNKKDICVDFFSGSGSFAHSCLLNKRQFLVVDENPQAISVMRSRLGKNIRYLHK